MTTSLIDRFATPNAAARVAAALAFVAAATGGAANAQPATGLFQPDTATATSQFSGFYLAQYTIDGSGMDAFFGPYDAHANYDRNNHWTTRSGAIPATATYGFDTPVDLNALFLWNHRSNAIASNATYEVTRFDLTLLDDQDNVLLSLTDLAAEPDTAVGQVYEFDRTSNVSTVQIRVTSNQTLDLNGGGSSSFTGLAEVAFASDYQTVLLPGDFNGSGAVEQGDLDLVLGNWGVNTETAGIPAGWVQDRPYGVVNQSELDRVLGNWGSANAPASDGSAVPEPAHALLGAAVAFGLTRRKTRGLSR